MKAFPRSRSRSHLGVAILLAATAGCASNRHAGLTDLRGQSLSVAPVITQVPEVRVTEVRNAGGALVGTEQTVTGYRPVTTGYSLKLGDDRIDEQDFYHLAGDRNSEDVIAHARSKGMLMNRVGIGVMLASVTTAIALPIVTDNRKNATYSVGQAFITFPIGLALAYFGKWRVENQRFSAVHAFGALETAPPPWATTLDKH